MVEGDRSVTFGNDGPLEDVTPDETNLVGAECGGQGRSDDECQRNGLEHGSPFYPKVVADYVRAQEPSTRSNGRRTCVETRTCAMAII